MRDERQLLEFLFSLGQQSPHAAAYSRRHLLRMAGRLGLGAGAAAALARLLPPPVALAADPPALPEITSIPEKLKGSGTVRVCSYGGAFQEAQRKAYFEPFERLSGIKVVEAQGPDPVKVKAMVDTKNVEYDVGEFDRASVINLLNKGDYWEEIDYSLVDTNNIDKNFQFKYALDMLPYAQTYAWRTDVFKDAKPASWADFWDTKKFPGPRTMPAGSGGLTPFLEAAVLADGAPMDKIYPIDIDKAYASLTKIKSSVVKWWEAGAIPAQMLNDKEAVMAVAWNGRIAPIQASGAPVEIGWRQGALRTDAWAVPKGAANRANAQKFTAFITMPVPQARLSMLIPYGFVNNAAAELVPAERLKTLPTSPDIKKQMFIYNSQWWADNRDKVIAKWSGWLLQ
ncbi:MAG: ABC transporter substrate-binding protein [Proteobacteria bacterium]|nr:ABC transporter substrate-binding protein [Pseudomonadota bacterium]